MFMEFAFQVGRYLIVTQDLKSNPDDCWSLYALKITNRKVKEDRILRLFVCGGKRTWLVCWPEILGDFE